MADDGRGSICQRRRALGGRRRDEQWRRVGGGAIGSEQRQRDWGNGAPGTLTKESGAGRSFNWVEPDQVGTAPSLVQGHPMFKTKFSLSKTGCNWVAVPTGSISKNQSVSRQKMENAVSASKDASFGMSSSKICLYILV